MDTTIGVDFYLSEIEVDGKKIKVKIWDTAGSEKYMSISAVYYRKADGVIFVFDMTRPRSFTDIVSVWMNAVEAQESGCPEAVKLLVGNKSDLSPEVDVSQIRRYAELHDMSFVEASAKSNQNVQHIFTSLANLIIQEKERKGSKGGNSKMDSVTLSNGKKTTPTSGCLLYTSPSPRDRTRSRMPSSA